MVLVWAPGLIVAALWASWGAARTAWGWRALVALAGLLARPRCQGALLLVLSTAVVAGQLTLLDREVTPLPVDFPVPEEKYDPLQVMLNLDEIDGQWCFTDAGQRIPLCAVPPAERERLARLEENRYVQVRGLSSQVIRTAEQTPNYNCHGWVFAGGRHWVRGAYVEQILKENGYKQVYRPQPGDVVVWRDEVGKVVHTGLVHSLSLEGRVLVESKWGVLGRYIHTPNEHCYQHTSFTYYHSPRGGHLLRGLDGSGPGRVPEPEAPRGPLTVG